MNIVKDIATEAFMNCRRLCFVLVLLVLPIIVQGQTTFLLSNHLPSDGVDAPILDAQGVPLAGPNYLAELYGGFSPGLISPVAASDGQPSVRVSVRFSKQGYVITRGVAVFGVFPGAFAWLQLRAWDARLGTSYEEAASRGVGGVGESPLFYAQGGGQTGGVPLGPGPLYGLQSFRLRPLLGVLMQETRLQSNQVTIHWHPGFPRYQLQQSPVLDQKWENLGEPTTATASTNQIGPGTKFYRVIGLLD